MNYTRSNHDVYPIPYWQNESHVINLQPMELECTVANEQLQLNDLKGESTLNDSSERKIAESYSVEHATCSIPGLILPERGGIQFSVQ